MISISFVIPVYNNCSFLRQCVGSVLAVQNGIVEIILVDDGSTDGSGILCDALQNEDSRVRVFHQDNKGVSAARNRGIEAATGDYVAFIDADDSVDSLLLTKLLLTVASQNCPDLVLYGLSFDYYRKQRPYRHELLMYSSERMLARSDLPEELPSLYTCNYLSSACNKLFRRDLLQNNNLRYDESIFLLEDLHFSVRALACADSAYCYDQPIYHYRQTEDEGNAGRRLKRISRVSSLMNKLEEAFGELGDSLGQKRGEYDDLLADIFLMLARQKIQVSRRKEIGDICDDWNTWLAGHRVSPDKLSEKYTSKLSGRKLHWLFWRSRYSSVRHTVANRVKYLRYLIKRRNAHG